MKNVLMTICLFLALNIGSTANACNYEFYNYLVDFGDYYAGGVVTTDIDKASKTLINIAREKGLTHSYTKLLDTKSYFKEEMNKSSGVDYIFVIFQMVDPTEPHFLIVENDKNLSRFENIDKAWDYLVANYNDKTPMPEEVIYYNSFVKYNPFASMAKRYIKHFSDIPECSCK